MRRFLPLLAAALAACNTGFQPQYRVEDLRILDVSSHALGSSSADVSPGDTLALAALVANPQGRPGLAVEWVACLPQASQAVPPCLDQGYLQDPALLVSGAGTLPGVVSLGAGLNVDWPVPSSPEVLAALEFVVGLAQQNATYACRLYAELVVVAIATAGDRQEVAYKRIPLLPPTAWGSPPGPVCTPGPGAAVCAPHDWYVLNLNPSVADVRLNPTDEDACTGGTSVAPAAFPSGEVVLCGVAGNGSSQAFNLCNPDGSTTSAFESLDWQWYATDGEFPDAGTGVGDSRGGHVKFQRPSGAFTLWTIVRDGRGGTEWASYAVTSM